MRSLIERLHREHTLAPDEFRILLSQCNDKDLSYINALAREVSHASFGNRILSGDLLKLATDVRMTATIVVYGVVII